MRAVRVAGALCVLAFQAAGSAPSGPGPSGSIITLAVSKAEIRITAGFHGDLLKVSGVAPRDSEVILRLSSPAEEETLDLKANGDPSGSPLGRCGSNPPRAFTNCGPPGPSRKLDRRPTGARNPGRRGLKASPRVQPGVDAGLFASELLRLKRDDGFYDTEGGGVTRGADGTYQAEFRWPARGPSESTAGRLRGQQGRGHRLRLPGDSRAEVGAEAWISRLAATHGLIYGLLAVLVALLTGLAASALFGRLGRGK